MNPYDLKIGKLYLAAIANPMGAVTWSVHKSPTKVADALYDRPSVRVHDGMPLMYVGTEKHLSHTYYVFLIRDGLFAWATEKSVATYIREKE